MEMLGFYIVIPLPRSLLTLQKVLEPAADLWDRFGVECNCKFRIRNYYDEVVMRGCDLTCVEELDRKQVQINHHFDYYRLWLSNLGDVTLIMQCLKKMPCLPSLLGLAVHCIIWLSHSPWLWFDAVSVNYFHMEYVAGEKNTPFHFYSCIATCQSHYFIRLVKWFLGKLIAAAAERIIISETRTLLECDIQRFFKIWS